ncbi:hypothetical protein [Pseudomonas putida]|uniref:hypothetical protein n=1 Tax=Pseudomonas putida TaxID=303 RepID=UPI0018D8F145|nr:hypothetical protein [Pseudomonas putida]MBH3412933.1 hypothetical protein [Pseudomonas putida]
MKRIMLIGAVGLGLISGCGKSIEDKMVSACTDIAKMSVADPSSMVVNSGVANQNQPTERNLSRFAGLHSVGGLTADQKAALEIKIKEISKVKESFVEIDFTDKSSGAKREKAVCWFMNTGQGFELGSVSVAGETYSGISLVSLFVTHARPAHLNSSNIVE